MSIRIVCLKCGRRSKIADEYAGKAIKCPGCGERVRVDPPAEETSSMLALPGMTEEPAADLSLIQAASTAVSTVPPPLPKPARQLNKPVLAAVVGGGLVLAVVAGALLLPGSENAEPVVAQEPDSMPEHTPSRPDRFSGEAKAKSEVLPYAIVHGSPSFPNEGLTTTTLDNGNLLVNGVVSCEAPDGTSTKHAYVVALRERGSDWELLGVLFDGVQMFLHPDAAKVLASIKAKEREEAIRKDVVELDRMKPEGTKLMLLARAKMKPHVPYKNFTYKSDEEIFRRADGLVLVSGHLALRKSGSLDIHAYKPFSVVLSVDATGEGGELKELEIDGKSYGP